jgi:hypothetical protein
VHVDVRKLGHIRDGGGWRVHGRDSAQSRAARSGPWVGYNYVHVAVDDHSRLAYVEVITLPEGGENQHACAGFVRRATNWFADNYGVTVERIMTDNAWAYRKSRLFAAALAELGIAHRPTKPRCPWTGRGRGPGRCPGRVVVTTVVGQASATSRTDRSLI